MYAVVSRWEFDPKDQQAFFETGVKMRAIIRGWPEVDRIDAFQSSDHSAIVTIVYRSEADYQRLIQDPNGPFEKAAKEQGIEEIGRWVWSERGELID